MVIRPKSMVTVVVRLASTPDRSSEWVLAEVSTSSVCRGRISLTVPTIVVLPAPNPPATRIFIAVGTDRARSSRMTEAKDHRLEDVVVRDVAGGHSGRHADDGALVEQVGEQHPDHTEGKPGAGGEFG